MADAPEKIWIDQDDCPYFYEESELAEAGSPVTEYIRADLCHPPALEPSAARELALEEAARKLLHDIDDLVAHSDGVFGLHQNGDNSPWDELLEGGRFEGWLGSVEELRRALSSPDHADAGKVEGDGWHVEYEVYSEDEWQAASTDLDGALDYAVMYAADGFKNITVQEVRRRTLPSAPSDGAE